MEFPADFYAGGIEVFADAQPLRAGHDEAKYRECHGWCVPDGQYGINSLPSADEQAICDALRQEAVLEDGAVDESPVMSVPDPAGVVHEITIVLYDFWVVGSFPQQAGLIHAGGIDVDELQKHQQQEDLEDVKDCRSCH